MKKYASFVVFAAMVVFVGCQQGAVVVSPENENVEREPQGEVLSQPEEVEIPSVDEIAERITELSDEGKKVDVPEKDLEEMRVSAGECVAKGGTYNTAQEKCFMPEDADEDLAAKADAMLEISADDSEAEKARKTCIAQGGTYNSIHRKCFSNE